MTSDFASLGLTTSAALQAASTDIAPLSAQETTGTTGTGDQPLAATDVALADLATGTEPLPIDYDLALLSMDVGSPISAGPGELNGWSRCTQPPPGVTLPDGGWMDGNGVIYGPDGMQCAIYQRGDDYVLVFAGTGVTGAGDQDATVYVTSTTGAWAPITIPGGAVGVYNDWQTNGVQAVGFCPAQHKFAMDLAGEMVEAYPGQVMFAGHSLGGGLASAASLATGAPAVTFNAAGLGDGVIDYATEQRNAREGTSRSEDELVAEADNGGIRAYRTDNDILTALQEGDAPHLPGDLPEAVGHPIEITDPAWSPLPEITGNHGADLLNGLANLLLTGHMMETVEGGMFTETRPAVAIEGMTVTVLDPPSNSLSVAGTEQTVVTFADTPAGHAAMRSFLITGQLPPDMVGVTRVSTTGQTPGNADRSMTTTTYYGDTGLPTSSRTSVYDDGVEVATISSTYDAAGSEITEQRTYTFPITPANDEDAAKLNVLFGYGPNDGPFRVGETTTITLTEAQMSNLEGDAVPVAGGGDVNILAEGDGDAGTFDSTTDFALDLLGTHSSSFADLLFALRTNAGRKDEPIEGVVTPSP